MNPVPDHSPDTASARFEPLTLAQLDAVLAVEQQAYAHPWNRTNFLDTLHAGYQAQVLMGGDTVLGYFVAMKGVDEAHLLNITVAPSFRSQGWARLMLDALAIWATGQGCETLWLEVRVGNTLALAVYERHGFVLEGTHRAYAFRHGRYVDAHAMARLHPSPPALIAS